MNRSSGPPYRRSAISASCDFALPAGTPPNAIVFGSGYVSLPTMMRAGFAMDLAAIGLVTLYASTWIPAIAPLIGVQGGV